MRSTSRQVRVPIPLLSGRFDFFYPIDSSRLPMFELFRLPYGQKRASSTTIGHNIPRPERLLLPLTQLEQPCRIFLRHQVEFEIAKALRFECENESRESFRGHGIRLLAEIA
jgi:hypothetical protein